MIEGALVADHGRKGMNDLRIADVLALGCEGHQQMVFDHPDHQPPIFPLDAMPIEEVASDVGADLGVIAAAAFADVMHESCDIEQLRLLDAFEDLAGEGELAARFHGREATQVPDNEQRVFVHGVDMKEVVLHAADDPGERRNISGEDAIAVHFSKLPGDATGLSKEGHEGLAGPGVVPEVFVNEREILANQSNGGGSDAFELGLGLQQQKDVEEG